ncbi:unnamed protein product, partial [Mesorhabditis spiculigera]
MPRFFSLFAHLLFLWLGVGVNSALFKTKEIEIDGKVGDSYVISANAEDLFQRYDTHLEVNLVCSLLGKTVFSAKIDSCLPEIDVDEWWHFHYSCDLTVTSDDWDGTASKRNVLHADPYFPYRRQFLISVGIEEGKYVLWSGDKRKPWNRDIFQRYSIRAELSAQQGACIPDRLVIRGTVWRVQYTYVPGPETTTTTTTTMVPETTTTPVDETTTRDGGGIVESIIKQAVLNSGLFQTTSTIPSITTDANTGEETTSIPIESPGSSSAENMDIMVSPEPNPFNEPPETPLITSQDAAVISQPSTEQPDQDTGAQMVTETAGLVLPPVSGTDAPNDEVMSVASDAPTTVVSVGEGEVSEPSKSDTEGSANGAEENTSIP